MFGVVQDLTIPDAVANLPIIDASSVNPAWASLPVLDSSRPDILAPDNLFRIESISVVPEPTALGLLAVSLIAGLNDVKPPADYECLVLVHIGLVSFRELFQRHRQFRSVSFFENNGILFFTN